MNYFCYKIEENKIETNLENKTISSENLVNIFIPIWLNVMPYIYHNNASICGVFIKLIVELSIKHGYRLKYYLIN